ncbi:THO complex subunit 1 transcription elongation factor [Babesia microti strain RI]|uniref:THO complex subunit 1 transcription elongation factor n=1 Tax=Babesia microti (strain RI) TaxID=1133968 RepID=A0A1R4AC42_BABMR|nr:THO complex subunit 1 transcription elongation factor [Babesia microti strain RI]SJK86591.1 THO complex subunit 1 transcription elongation factor [Babesia microti strain RI]|eukprot:XP_021338731.1 THO complex subunit 1 transcription elongation factor [Babesia microti strain RI]
MDIFQGILPISSELTQNGTLNLPKDDIRHHLIELWQLLLKQDELNNSLLTNINYRKSVVEQIRTILKNNENKEGDISSKSHANFILSFKIISVYLINNLTHCSDAFTTMAGNIDTINCIIDILLSLVPDSLDLVIFIDILTELAKVSTIASIAKIVNHVYCQLKTVKKHYIDMETICTNKRRMQTAGAKLIFFVKSIENRMIHTEFLSHPQLSFQLRCILIECLPMSHLGISNKHGLSQIQTTFITTEPDALKFLEEFVQRQPCETMENYTDEITSDYKYKLCNFEPILKLPNYKIYTSYKFTLSFSHLSHNMEAEDESYFSELLDSYQCLLNFYRTLNPNSKVKGPLFAWYKDGIDRGNGIIFSMVCNDVDFWKQFIVESFMALMDLYRVTKPLNPNEEYLCLFNRASHVVFQPDKESIYAKKPTKIRAIINEIQKVLVKFSTKISGFTKFLTTLLATEAQWVYWKRNGCADLLTDITPSPYVEDTIMDPIDESIDTIGNDRDTWINWLKDCMENKEECGVKRAAVQKGNEIGCLSRKFTYETSLRVDPINLDRQADEWGLDVPPNELTDTLETKLNAKLSQYRKKMQIDLDPENQVETPSSEDNVFRFRLGKLFTMHYMDKFVNSTFKLPIGNTCSNMEYIMSSLDQIIN